MRGKVYAWVILVMLFIVPANITVKGEENPEPYFSISILAPNSGPARNQWATLMVEQLPKIGIGIDIFDHTGWSQISPRTWGYPGPYPIPQYSEGGFDILFVGWSWGLDWDPTGLFDTPNITPVGDNFYQYSNPIMDQTILDYTSSLSREDRLKYIKKIQYILYDDLPQISIIYEMRNYAHDSLLEGWNSLLWDIESEPMYNWSFGEQTSFTYASPADFEDFHPLRFDSVYDQHWLYQIFCGLLERNASIGNFQDNFLTESFSTTNGQVYSIKLKDSICWADGTPLTTDDVIFNYQLLVNPIFNAESNYYFDYDYSDFINYLDNNSITKINDQEFTVTFIKKYAFLENYLSVPLIPKHIWESVPLDNHSETAYQWAKNNPEKMFGVGPYKLEKTDETTGMIHLVTNPNFENWFGVSPKIDDVYFQFYSNKEGALAALENGVVDIVDAQFSPQIDELNLEKYNYTLVPGSGQKEMALNMNHPYLGTGELCPIAGEASARHIRKAISFMVPREIIIDEVLHGLGFPGCTACPRSAIGFDEKLGYYEYSKKNALLQMQLAGFDVDATFLNSTNIIGVSFFYNFLFATFIGAIIYLIKQKILRNQ